MSSRSNYIVALWPALLLTIAVGCSKEARLQSTLGKAERFAEAGDYLSAEIEYANCLRLEPSSAAALSGMGFVYFEQGRWLQAYTFLARAKDVDPENVDVRLKLGMAEFVGGKHEEARNEALFVLSKQPTNDTAFLLLADASRTTNHLADSFKRLEQLRKAGGERTGYHLAMAALHMRDGDWGRARLEIKQAVELDPDNVDAQAALGKLYVMENDLERADIHLKRAADLDGWRSMRKVAYAQFKIQLGETEEGKRLLEEVIENAPDFFPAWIRLAEQGFNETQYDQCREVVDAVLRRDPQNHDARLLLGRLFLAQGEPGQALAEFEPVSKVFPDTAALHYYLGLAHSLDGDPLAALASLARALHLDPGLGDAVLLQAELYIRNGEPGQAVISLGDFMSEYQVSRRGLLLLVEAHRRAGNIEKALEICQEWARLFPADPQAWITSGQLLLSQNRRSLAREAFGKVLELEPNNVVAIEELVNLDLLDKDGAGAFERAERLLAQFPESPIPLVLLAKVHDAEGRFSDAEACLLEAIELAPDASTPYLILAQVQIHSDRIEDALANLQKALSLEPENALALLQLGTLQEKMGNPLAAVEAYEALLEIDPVNGLAMNNLAYLYSARLNDLDQAYELAMRARAALPRDPAVMDTLGWIRYQRGEYNLASTLLRGAASQLPGQAEVWFHVGMNAYMLGDEEEARVALEKARGMARGFDGSDALDERLAMLTIDPKSVSPEIEQDLEDKLRQGVKDPIGWVRLGAIRERDGDSPGAARAYEKAISISPAAAPFHLKPARLYLRGLNDPQKGLDYARTARKLAPDDPEVARTLGELAYRTGDHRWAASLLQESAARLPTEPGVYFSLALAELSIGEINKATDALQTALRQAEGPDADKAQEYLSLCELMLNPDQLEGSAGWVSGLLAADPNHFPASYVGGLLLEQQGDLGASRAVYEKILNDDQFPSFSPARKRLAVVSIRELSPSSAEALHLAREARLTFPDDSEVASVLGIVAYHNEHYDLSAELLAEVTRRDNPGPESFFYLGMAQFRLDQKNTCRSALQKALALGLQDALAETARETLATLD